MYYTYTIKTEEKECTETDCANHADPFCGRVNN